MAGASDSYAASYSTPRLQILCSSFLVLSTKLDWPLRSRRWEYRYCFVDPLTQTFRFEPIDLHNHSHPTGRTYKPRPGVDHFGNAHHPRAYYPFLAYRLKWKLMGNARGFIDLRTALLKRNFHDKTRIDIEVHASFCQRRLSFICHMLNSDPCSRFPQTFHKNLSFRAATKKQAREWELSIGDWQEYFLHTNEVPDKKKAMDLRTLASTAFS